MTARALSHELLQVQRVKNLLDLTPHSGLGAFVAAVSLPAVLVSWAMLRAGGRLPSQIVFLASCLFAALLLQTVAVAHKARKQASELEHANTQLAHEVAGRLRAEQTAQQWQLRWSQILDTWPEAVILLDAQQLITSFNRTVADTFGYRPEELVGRHLNILLPEGPGGACRDYVAKHKNLSGLHKDGRRLPVEASIFRCDVSQDAAMMVILRDRQEQVQAEQEWCRERRDLETRVWQRTEQWIRSHKALQTEIAERKKAEASLRALSGRLLRLQDEERRRIARELHDSTSQALVAVSMNIAFLQQGRGCSSTRAASILQDCASLVEQCSTEIRTISYLLHPPVLDELGLASALSWAASGFSMRSGIEVEVDVPEDLGRFSQDVELAIYRVVQEALTNIHRHSHSRTATITARHDSTGLTVSIEDQGCGFSRKQLQAGSDSMSCLGVGITGMRERLRQLGGSLDIGSSACGTRITAQVPLVQDVADNPVHGAALARGA